MSQNFSTRVLHTLSIAGVLLISIGNAMIAENSSANAGEIPTVEINTIDRPSRLAQNLGSSQGDKNNDLGLGIQFGNSTSVGINGKFKVSENFSVRPAIYFGSQPGVESKGSSTPTDFTTISPFTLPQPLTISRNFTTTTAFTTNVPITFNGTTIPSGTVIPAGTQVSQGTVLPTGLTLPANVTIPVTSVPSGLLTNTNKGTALSIALTYDFKLDAQGQTTAYIGPSLSFTNASGPLSGNGGQIPNSKIDVNETKIGLIAGADVAVSDAFTVGANLTYNFSRNISGSLSAGGQSFDFGNSVQSTGSAIDFGIRGAYRF